MTLRVQRHGDTLAQHLPLSRRTLLRLLGGVGATAVLTACGQGTATPTTTQPGTTTTAATTAGSNSAAGSTSAATSAATTTSTRAASTAAATGAGATPGSGQAAASLIQLPPAQFTLPKDKITFRWVDSGGLKQFFFQTFFPMYEKARPNITIKYDVLPWPEIAKVVPLGVQNGNVQDVFQIPQNITGGEVVQQGWVHALDDVIPDFANWKKAFPAGVFLPGITDFNGKTYAFPLWSNLRTGTLLLYNTSMMQQAGYDPAAKPLTWDDFRAAAKKLTTQGKGQAYGYVIGGSQTGRFSEIVGNLAGMAGAVGGDINWKTGEYNYGAPEYVAATELLVAMKQDGSIFPGSLSLNAQQARARFPQGVAGMILQGPWNIPQWQQDNPDFNFGVASQPVPNSGTPLPLTIAPGAGDLFWLYAKSPYGDIAGDIFHYVGSKDGQRALLALSGGSSPVLYPEVNEAATDVGPLAHKALDIFAQQVRRGPGPEVRNPEVAQVNLELKPVQPDLGQVVQGIFAGQISDAKKALQDLADRANKELDRAIKAAQAKGAKVSRDDWKFANWDPTKDYTQADYDALK
jgi:multiple sugar transport system substrate-binding protein